jgi:protein phosphatase
MTRFLLQAYGCTDTGLVRTVNEDHILLGRFIKNSGSMSMEFAADDDFLTSYGLLFAVADGIGGAAAGDIASRLALTTLERHFYGFEKSITTPEAYQQTLLAAANRANETVMQYAASRPECRGMGCTLTGVCLMPSGYLVFNSGDSRVYRFRSGFLKQLTDDDTLVNLAVKAGQMTYEEAEQSSTRHTITNSIGYADFRLKCSPGPELRDGDRLLICSDGLHDLVSIEVMERIIEQHEPEQATAALIAAAKENGGNDNISIILMAYIQEPIILAEKTGEEPSAVDVLQDGRPDNSTHENNGEAPQDDRPV